MMQMDLFDLFNENGMSSFIEPTLEKAVKKEENEQIISKTTDEALDLDDNNDELEYDSDEIQEMTKSSVKSNNPKSSKKKGKNLSGNSMVTLPVICYGRNWTHRIDGFGEKTINDILVDLKNAGIEEVSHKDVSPIADEKRLKKGMLFFTSPQKANNDNVAIFTSSNKTVYADGLEQMSLTPDMFVGKDKDEISVLDGQFLFEKNFPIYQNLSISFCSSSNIGVPVITKTIADGDKIVLPKNIVVNGEVQPVQLNLFDMGAMEVLGSEIKNHYFSGLDVILKCIGNTIFCEYKGTPISSLKKPNVFGTSKEVIAKELYNLPCKCYFVTLNQTFDLVPEMFNCKTKISEQEVLELLRKNYSLLRNKDRRIEVIYAREQNLVSVALTSGTKGSSYALPESSTNGLFKLIRSVEELQEIKALPNFLGNYVPEFGAPQRIEVCPHGVFTATMGEGRLITQIQCVSFESKLPKIPKSLFLGILEDFKAHADCERIVQICWDEGKKEYYLSFPSYEESGKSFIKYRFHSVPPMITIHSHNTMPAFFSTIDNKDEAITGIYGVIGNVDTVPTYKFRVGMEGFFQELKYSELFEEV